MTSLDTEPLRSPDALVDVPTLPLAPGALERSELVALASACGLPRVSLFWPRGSAGGLPHQAWLAGLVRDAELELARQDVPPEQAQAILAPARALVNDPGPAASFHGSLGLLASATEARLFALPHAVEPRAWVSGRYRVSPLVPLVEGDGAAAAAAQRRLAMALASGRARFELPTVLVHARAGRVELLVVALEARAWGTFDERGRVEIHATRRAGDEELVDLAVAYALGHGAEVHAVPGDRLPGGGMVAALGR